MKTFLVILASLHSVAAVAASGNMEDQIRAVAAAKAVNERMQPLINSSNNGAGQSDIFGAYGKNACAIKMADTFVESNGNFTVITPCGEDYQIVVTGTLGDGDEQIRSAMIEKL